MSKYDALGEFLFTLKQTEIKLTFSEIEKILGFGLPKSANTYSAWWANGGHPQAESWKNAGFVTKKTDLRNRTILFCKREEMPCVRDSSSLSESQNPGVCQEKVHVSNERVREQSGNILSVCGYEFCFIQQLIPVCEKGRVKEYYPQEAYDNKNNLPLLPCGSGAFCRFSIHAHDIPGVYLWVADREIIYIGQTDNLRKRFNTGYGRISPRKCYVGGQSTNCRMNKVAMECFKNGKPVDLYFHQTENSKQVELELLKRINTKYNVKDN